MKPAQRRADFAIKLVVLCISLFSLPSLGQQSGSQQTGTRLTQLTLEQLGNVEVTTVSKQPEVVWRTPAAIYVVTSEDIRRSGVTSIPEALRLAPGVEVGRIESNIWAVGIRGLESNFSKAVLVLIDGRSVYTPLFAGVYWDVQDVVLDDIDRIEVIRGPGATVWGPNSANGVINIITKSAADTHGMLVSAVGGNVDRFIGKARYGGGNGKTFDYRVYGKGFTRGPEFHSDGSDFDGWHQERGGFRMDWNLPSHNSYNLQGDVYGGVSPHEIGTTPVVDSVSGGNVLARWRHDFRTGSALTLQGYFDRTIRIGGAVGETRNTVDISFNHHFKFGERHDFVYGTELRWSPNHVLPQTASVNVIPNILTDHIYTAFIQDELRIAKNISLTLGSTLEQNNFTGFNLEPTARLLWTRGAHQSFWAAITRAVTTPSRIEEGFRLSAPISVNPPLSILVSGNPQFKDEASTGYEGGYRQLLTTNIYVDLALFHNAYDHLQSFSAPTLNGNFLTILYGNVISGSTNGVEIAPSWTPTTWWKVSGSYSYVAADMHASGPTSDISSTGSVKTYEGSTPVHQFEARSLLNLPKNFEFDQFYRYASALPAQKVRAYQTMDVRLGWRFAPGWDISVNGQNLFQRYHYEWGTGDPTQPLIGIRRAAYVKLTWTK